MRVLHVSQPADAGVPAVVAGLAVHQSALGWDVHVATPPGSDLDQRTWAPPVGVHEWPAVRSPGTSVPAEIARLRAIVSDVAPDVMHLHSAKAGLVGRLAVGGRVPTVFQPHAWSFEAVSGPTAVASRAWERLGARWADVIACVSEAERDLGIAEGVAADYRVVPNGVDTDRFVPADAAAARRRLGWPDAPTVVVVGRLSHQKGQDVAVDAWPIVRREIPGARLVLVGDGPDEAHLRSRVAGDSGISFSGRAGDPRDSYTAADIVAVPSRWEGMALVPLEAAASGRCVVGTAVAGMAASIGPGGAVVPVADAAALADALLARLRDPALRLAEGTAGRNHVMTNHQAVDTWWALTDLAVDVVAARRAGR